MIGQRRDMTSGPVDMHAVTWGVQCIEQNKQSISTAMQVGVTATLGNCRTLFYVQLCLFKTQAPLEHQLGVWETG